MIKPCNLGLIFCIALTSFDTNYKHTIHIKYQTSSLSKGLSALYKALSESSMKSYSFISRGLSALYKALSESGMKSYSLSYYLCFSYLKHYCLQIGLYATSSILLLP